MAINTKGFSVLVQTQVAAIQAAAAGLVDFTVGAITLALVEAYSQVGLWLQGLVLALLATTRAATSYGADLISWMADFGLLPLLAVSSTGSITFSRFTATSQGLVPVGGLVATSDGSQQFTVVADPTNTAYSASLGGYVLPVNTASVTVPVQAAVPGVAGNVAAATVTTIVSAMQGIDTVLNASPFAGGQNQESDPSFRARFIAYLGSLRTSNDGSITFAIQSVQAGLRFGKVDCKTYPGLLDKPGYFFVVVDDGSGNPPAPLLAAVWSAIEAVRGEGIQHNVFGPTVVTVNIGMTLTTDPAYTHGVVVAAVAAALSSYIAALPLGAQTISLTKLAQIAYGTSPGVTNVTGVTINSASADLVLVAFNLPRPGTMTVV